MTPPKITPQEKRRVKIFVVCTVLLYLAAAYGIQHFSHVPAAPPPYPLSRP